MRRIATRRGGSQSPRTKLRSLQKRCRSPKTVVRFLKGMAQLRSELSEPSEIVRLRLLALQWLLEQLAIGQPFPPGSAAPVEDALQSLFDGGRTARDAARLVAFATEGLAAVPRVDASAEYLCGHGAIVGERLAEASELCRAVTRFGRDPGPIRVISSSIARPRRSEIELDGELPLKVAEGELLSIGGVMCLLQYSYPQRPIIAEVAMMERECSARRMLEGTDAVCLGGDNSNSAIKVALECMREKDKPSIWVDTSVEPNCIHVPGREAIVAAPNRPSGLAAGGGRKDGAIVHTGARHRIGDRGKVVLLTGTETYGTAIAASAFVDTDFLYSVASGVSGSRPSTHVLEGYTSGVEDIWPVHFRAVYPKAWTPEPA